MKYAVLGYFIILSAGSELARTQEPKEWTDEENIIRHGEEEKEMPKFANCWMSLNSAELFKVMDEIDARYENVRLRIQHMVHEKNFDDTMLQGFLGTGGAAIRELYQRHYHLRMIPSGLNLGGYCMQRMPESVLFFHRMKLRNNTFFRVDYLKNDLAKMVLHSNLSLNDLHLKGAYERALTDRDPSTLIYAPTFGEVEILLKDVKYKLEGRYRLIKERLVIELVTSEITVDDVLMTYMNQAIENQAIRVSEDNVATFISRLKNDLDKWIKDYFNDFLIYAGLEGIHHIDELEKYDKEKGTALEKYTDDAILIIKERLRDLHAEAILVPDFTFKTVHGLQIKLYEGVLRGLDSIYRRSVATGIKQGLVRKVDTIVGFSNLKIVYKYEAVIPTGVPPLTGVMTLSANELSAHLSLAMVDNPETVDLDLHFLEQMKPESLTVEGAANIMISNFKHLLEHQIVAIMSNTLIHGVTMLRSLPKCVPFLSGILPRVKSTTKKPISIQEYGSTSLSEEKHSELTEKLTDFWDTKQHSELTGKLTDYSDTKQHSELTEKLTDFWDTKQHSELTGKLTDYSDTKQNSELTGKLTDFWDTKQHSELTGKLTDYSDTKEDTTIKHSLNKKGSPSTKKGLKEIKQRKYKLRKSNRKNFKKL